MTRAPVHYRQLDQHKPTSLAYEERFGLVKRPDFLKPNSTQVYMQDLTAFQYEYGRWLRGDDGRDITNLHEGHLYDENQQPITNNKTGRKVRLRRKVEHRQLGTLSFDVDEDLNLVLSNSSAAQTVDLDFGLQSNAKITSLKFDLNILQSSNQSFAQSLTIRTPRTEINSPSVVFGFAPVQPAVLGTTLTGAILTPIIAQIQAALALMIADSAFSDQPTKDGLKAINQSISGIAGAVPSILSTQVQFTA